MPKKTLIMVVEDEADLANNIAEIIKKTNKYDVIVSYSAREALEHISKNKLLMGLGGNRIQLVLLDIKMPEMDGLQFLAELRQEYPPDKMGVLIITAWEDHDKWEKARQGFVVGYIKKPFKSDELLGAIDRFFAGKGKWMIEQTKWETLDREHRTQEEK